MAFMVSLDSNQTLVLPCLFNVVHDYSERLSLIILLIKEIALYHSKQKAYIKLPNYLTDITEIGVVSLWVMQYVTRTRLGNNKVIVNTASTDQLCCPRWQQEETNIQYCTVQHVIQFAYELLNYWFSQIIRKSHWVSFT